ncbi:MAG: hypothetical protein QOJ35_2630 [Solirubrobacteraceae bacterium]|jgi:hypothetical protein|nr:hypothetical protein [Solirubrobacteraceae bacterium]
MPPRSLAVLVLLAASAMPSSAAARAWSAPGVLLAACGARGYNCVAESAPRAAVNARGTTLVAWVSGGPKAHVQVAAAGPGGRFERPITMGVGLRPSVAVARGGVEVVVWEGTSGLMFARRAPSHRFSRARPLLGTGATRYDGSPKLAAQPDGGTLVVYGSRTGLHSVLISPAGRPGSPRELGLGSLKHDSFRAAPNGQVAVCCMTPPAAAVPPLPALPPPSPPTPVALYAPGAGWSILTPPLAAGTEVETVGPGAGAVALGTIDVQGGGEVGTQGVPGLLRIGPGGTFAPNRTGPVRSARRALGPVVAIDGSDRDVLVYQEKDRPAAFSRDAPVYAVVSNPLSPFGARQVLDRGLAHEPAVSAYRDGAVAAWQAPGNRWRVSVERDGRFERAQVPAGPGPSMVGEDFNYSHDMAADGRYVVLAWTALDGSVRASVGTP